MDQATFVWDMLVGRLRAANLEDILRPDKSQCLDMENSVWVEVVLSDGAELERAEAIVAEVKNTFHARGTRVDGIVRAVWELLDVTAHGPVCGQDGAPRAAEAFFVSLKSGSRLHTVVVEVTYSAEFALRYRLDRAAPTGKAEEKQLREEIIALVRRFVEYESRQGGLGFWDPLKHPRRELNEPAVLFFSGQRD